MTSYHIRRIKQRVLICHLHFQQTLLKDAAKLSISIAVNDKLCKQLSLSKCKATPNKQDFSAIIVLNQ